jgi:predicted membrane metal-binding protein
MVTGDLGTTNMWLAIMAIVSVLEALLLIGMAIGGFLAYRRVMQLASELEARQISPVREKVDAILVDVKAVTARVSAQTERVNHAISGTIDRVDETADRVTGSVRDKVNQAVGMARGIRAMVMSVLGHEVRHEPPTPAAGRV